MPYRVMVVDDSAFMRKIISDLIEQDPDFQVSGTATNGREAIEMIGSVSPDLVTMDVEMPEMNGLEALQRVMKEHPLPVIMLSGINEQGMRETILALELGAFDFIRKPSATTSSHDIEKVGRDLREQMRAAMAAKERKLAREKTLKPKGLELQPPTEDKTRGRKNAPVLPKPSAGPPGWASGLDQVAAAEAPKEATKRAVPKAPDLRGAPDRPKPALMPEEKRPIGGGQPSAKSKPGKERGDVVAKPPSAPVRERNMAFTDLVAIGTSTGGPKALKAVLEKLPADFPAPVVIVQHMPPNFTKSLAQRLHSLSALTVVEAEEGMALQAGTAYIAPGGFHLHVVSGAKGSYKVSLSKQELRNGHRPSVDVLYESLLPLTSLKRHIVLLTGMGSDGARSMKLLYDSGVSSTIAESEETCVVYGMPRSAIELGCVSRILPLHEIGSKLAQDVK
ncbi:MULTISPECIES: chemotaxis response regulator protein-glutamate methylesterase [Paenibacillus]|uniref:protein-glutamate methylesterase/protein-glutamine glutaminase n=1 Tax=Paenibacillus TaxID=44249 RepID=UPI002FE2C5BC